LKKALEELHMHGFTPLDSDSYTEHVKEVQNRLSNVSTFQTNFIYCLSFYVQALTLGGVS